MDNPTLSTISSSSSPPRHQPLTTFPLFPKLPLELRLMIFHCALLMRTNDRSLVPLDFDGTDLSLTICQANTNDKASNNNSIENSRDKQGPMWDLHFEVAKIGVKRLDSNIKDLALSAVNHETRGVFLKMFGIAVRGRLNRMTAGGSEDRGVARGVINSVIRLREEDNVYFPTFNSLYRTVTHPAFKTIHPTIETLFNTLTHLALPLIYFRYYSCPYHAPDHNHHHHQPQAQAQAQAQIQIHCTNPNHTPFSTFSPFPSLKSLSLVSTAGENRELLEKERDSFLRGMRATRRARDEREKMLWRREGMGEEELKELVGSRGYGEWLNMGTPCVVMRVVNWWGKVLVVGKGEEDV
ncbi:hypothetical protein BKA65DRAFT_560309 [Rhexocercosporidium sp. MPI-PUGE-AT-0058]|nr:hypothetical protein BKA65DRAFT_560309 [Rhexocercosporidium sp. MPI-PUGE-AT-0058]